MTNLNKPRRMARPLAETDAPMVPEDGNQQPLPVEPAKKRSTKQSLVLDLLQADGGTTLNAIVDSTGWQAHTARAVLTGLRKKGHSIERLSIDGVTHYRILGVAAQ